MESGTTALRNAAPEWNLAGDKNLLQVLEDIHQKLMTKCQEVNTKLDEMVNKLDNASVDLQNVNNKFLALSNSQFIESRVYDDDVTPDEEQKKKTGAPVNEEDVLSKVKYSLQTFERMHEAVRILDSDSSDDEDDFSTILKPKDMYSDRPLPYIIGSHQWKTKWHVGLVPSESDSDSSEDLFKKPEPREQYSESESENEGTYQKDAAHVSSSSDIESEPSPGPSGVVKPADIAAQIAKRLVAQQPPLETESREPSISESGPRKVYRAERPGTIPVFSEEPPPLDESIDDYSDNNNSDEDDIFAELHRKPSNHRQSNPLSFDPFVEKLFGDEVKQDEPKQEEKMASSMDNSILIKNDSKANSPPQQEDRQAAKSNDTSRKEQTVKKPVSGVPLFGSSQGAESIGAAILKRNQRKASISDDDDKAVEENTQPHGIVNSVSASTNKIIEDLFTKPKSSKKEIIAEKVSAATAAQKITPKPKIDLFSDNIFDDVDDIFTSEIITKPKETNHKSIFEDDDLFADVPTKTVAKDTNKNSIFDSDDELFKENLNESAINNSEKPVVTKINVTSKKKNTETSILFSDDNDSDDIFASNNNTPKIFQPQDTPEISNYTPTQIKNHIIHSANTIKNVEFNKNEPKAQHTQTASKTLNPNLQPKNFESPLLFDDDGIDDLFISNTNASKIKESKVETNKNEQIFDDDSVIRATKDSKENNHKAAEQHIMKGDLVVNNTECDEYLVTLPKSKILEENIINTPDNMLKITNNSDNNTNKDKNFVTEDSKVQNTKNNSLGPEESFGGTKNSQPVTVRNDSSLNASFDENVNSLGDPTTTESFASSIKHNQKQHDQLDDLFSDVPPVFEKPSEPKKSKNVNALFDDDSDDETLFFKKSDVTDEKPKSYNDDRFRIFHDEPPDVDVDFTTKTDNAFENVESDEDLFTMPKSNAISKNTPNSMDNKPTSVEFVHENIEQDDLFTKTQDSLENKKEESLDICKLLSSDIIDSNLNSEISNSIEKQTPNIKSEQDKTEVEGQEETSTKKSIGKLKPMNININVHSLLPVTSPTKQKTKDESDGSAFSTQSNEELNKYSSETEESKMVKSVSFDGNPGSEVLDNKLSKERARIQVKRRPSSRRARLEAVRKSGIDFTDDSNDNSSSFDEPKPVSSHHDQSELKKVPVHTSRSDSVSGITENTFTESNVALNRKFENGNNITTGIKSKTVYILHDEDIFLNSPNTKTDNTKKSLTTLDDDDDDENLFKVPSSTFAKNNKTLENHKIDLKKDKNENNNKNSKYLVPNATKSIFDDLSDDDELFGGKKSSESSSNHEKSKNTKKVKENIMSSIKTGSLIGDDSDDDDLFKANKGTESKATKPKEIATVKSTSVKDDPLSLFDDS